MDKHQAQQLIHGLFTQAFNHEGYEHFLRNLLNRFEPRGGHYTGNYIPDAFKQHVHQYWRIGKYVDPDGEELDLLVVEVKTLAKLERARSALRNFAVNRLKQFEKEASLIAFYARDDEGEDWRFSFVKIEHEAYRDEKGKVKLRQELTPARRYSFLVGVHENSHTAAKQLLPILTMDYADPRIEEIEAAFSIEKVSSEFFEQYKGLFQNLAEHLKSQAFFQGASEEETGQAVSRFAKKLLGQIVFLYFLQKKGWLGVPKDSRWGKGSRRFMSERFTEVAAGGGNYYRDFLQFLFYEALAQERKDQADPGYYLRFDCKIPFLNGGLFEAEYDWQNETIDLPNDLFHNQERNKAGDQGTGILDVFDRYNFTIKEDEPLEKEVAVDPEMLGKVFENMLEVTERKSKGAFYTPREIVHYMCQESLIHYIDNSLNSPNSPPFQGGVPAEGGGGGLNNLPHLKTLRKQLRNNLTPAEAALWRLLKNKQLKGRKFRRQHSVSNYILDFYCPAEKMAIELDGEVHNTAKQAEYDRERDLFLQYTGIKVLRFENKSVFKNPEGLLQRIQGEFGWVDKEPPRPSGTPPLQGGEFTHVPRKDLETLIRKGHLALENDQRVLTKGRETDTYKFQLPESVRNHAESIDQALTSIKVCDPAIGSGAFPVGLLHEIVNARLALAPHNGNEHTAYELKRHAIRESLYGVDSDASAIDIARLRLWLSLIVDEDNYDAIEALPNLDYKIVRGNSLIGFPEGWKSPSFTRVEHLKRQFFRETDQTKKSELKIKIDHEIQQRFKDSKKVFGWQVNFDFRLYFSEVWHEKDGFDVVIGNPPYVQIQKFSGQQIQKDWEKQKYLTFAKTGDIYCLFYEKGHQILRERGVLAFITSNKWMRANYGKKLRQFFGDQTTIEQLIDFGDAPIFSEATTYTNILLFEKANRGKPSKAWDLSTSFRAATSLERMLEENPQGAALFSKEGVVILPPELAAVKQRIEETGTPLKEWDITINYGIKTGFNKAFIIDGKKRDKLIARDPKSAEILKPILRGRDIKRYKVDFADLWLIFIPWHFPLHNNHTIAGASKKAEQAFKDEYPAIYHHIMQYMDKLTRRNKAETGIRYEWYALQRCAATYYQEFKKEKIIWMDMSPSSNFALSSEEIFVLNTSYILTGNHLKWIVAIANSSVMDCYFPLISTDVRGKTRRYFKQYVELLPIVRYDSCIANCLEPLVDYVKILKKADGNLQCAFFEQLIDGLVYELYFPDEIKTAGKDILPHLGEPTPLSDGMSDEEKLAVIQRQFDRLYDPSHPVRNNLETLDSVDVVRIIREALKK